MFYINCDCRHVDVQSSFPDSNLAVAQQASSLTLFSESLCVHFVNYRPHAAQQGDGEVSLEFHVISLPWLADHDLTGPHLDCLLVARTDGCLLKLHTGICVPDAK